MSATLPETSELIRSLKSDFCPICAGLKKPRQTMCGRCYHKLPRSLRSRLYDHVGEGYESAVAAAMIYLCVETFSLPLGRES